MRLYCKLQVSQQQERPILNELPVLRIADCRAYSFTQAITIANYRLRSIYSIIHDNGYEHQRNI